MLLSYFSLLAYFVVYFKNTIFPLMENWFYLSKINNNTKSRSRSELLLHKDRPQMYSLASSLKP